MKKRIISAIVMLLIFVPFLIIGSWPFTFLILCLEMMAIYELLNFRPKLPNFLKGMTYILTLLFSLYLVFKMKNLYFLDIKLIVGLLLSYLFVMVFLNKPSDFHYKDAFYLVGIVLFIGIAFSNLIFVRNLNLYLLIYLFLIATGTDTFAYFIGSRVGKHKLAPLISPHKTIEGLVGGTVLGVLVSLIFYILFVKTYSNLLVLIGLTLVLSLVGSLGDLVTSMIKRREKVKDFSSLIPGHGGILDRFDSIIFISLTYILIASLF